MPDWELLHAVVGLYDSYLPEITPEVLYSTLTCRSTMTLVFLKDVQGKQDSQLHGGLILKVKK